MAEEDGIPGHVNMDLRILKFLSFINDKLSFTKILLVNKLYITDNRCNIKYKLYYITNKLFILQSKSTIKGGLI